MTAIQMLLRYGPGIITNVTPPRNPFMEMSNQCQKPPGPTAIRGPMTSTSFNGTPVVTPPDQTADPSTK